MLLKPLQHSEFEAKDDAALREEALSHLSKSPPLQLIAELLTRLRALSLPWWSAEHLRAAWGAEPRMEWLSERVSLRQQITTSLSGLAPNAARKKAPRFQAELIESVIDDGDITPQRFEEAFDPCDLVVYGPAAELWHGFRDRMPWGDDAPVHQELIAWLMKALLSSTSSLHGLSRAPILTPWDVRTAIDGRVWHTHMPVEVRVAIDEARFKQERAKPREPFHARHDLSIALPEIIASSVPLRELRNVFIVAERAMKLAPKQPPATARAERLELAAEALSAGEGPAPAEPHPGSSPAEAQGNAYPRGNTSGPPAEQPAAASVERPSAVPLSPRAEGASALPASGGSASAASAASAASGTAASGTAGAAAAAPGSEPSPTHASQLADAQPAARTSGLPEATLATRAASPAMAIPPPPPSKLPRSSSPPAALPRPSSPPPFNRPFRATIRTSTPTAQSAQAQPPPGVSMDGMAGMAAQDIPPPPEPPFRKGGTMPPEEGWNEEGSRPTLTSSGPGPGQGQQGG